MPPLSHTTIVPEYTFTIIISGDVDQHLDELFEAGLDDAMFGTVDGVAYADVDREADSFAEAVASATRQVDAVPGLRVERIEPDDLVTAAEIAERLHRSRESIRLLAAGARGGGSFPRPVSHAKARARLWRWSDVLAWETNDDRARREALFVAAMNAMLELDHRLAELAELHEPKSELVIDRMGRTFKQYLAGSLPASTTTARKAKESAVTVKGPSRGDIHTVHRDGKWFNEVEGASRASNSAPTKSEAVQKGREMAKKRGVEHLIHRTDGTIGERNTYPRGRDPRATKG